LLFREIFCGLFADSALLGVAEKVGFFHHAMQKPANFFKTFNKCVGFCICQIVAIKCRLDPVLRFILLGICIGQFTRKVCFVATLSPSFCNLGTHRS